MIQNQSDSRQQEIDRLNIVISDHKEALSKKEAELYRIVEEKDDLLHKAGELEGKVIELDQIQRNDIEGLEQRVERTIMELKSAKDDNANLLHALSKAESALTEADSKYVTFRDKYYSKKTEANVLRDKVDKLLAEISRLKAENSRYNEALDHKRVQVAMNENKNKAYRDIKGIIDDFKNETIRKY
jgi:chromosome segregation ATPase